MISMHSVKPKQCSFLLTGFSCRHLNLNNRYSGWQDFHAFVGTQTVCVSGWQDFHTFIEAQTIVVPVDAFPCILRNPNSFVSCWLDFHAFIETSTIVVPVDKISMHSLEPKQLLFPANRISMPALKPKQSVVLFSWFTCIIWNPNNIVSCWLDFHAFIET